MKKLVLIDCSPRNMNGAAMLAAAETCAKELGAGVTTYKIHQLDIHYCQHCLYCRENPGCSIEDDMQDIYQAIEGADGVIVSFPIYMAQMNAQAKTFMDRLWPLSGPEEHRFGTPVKSAMIVTQGMPDPDFYRDYSELSAKSFSGLGLDMGDRILFAAGNDAATNADYLTKIQEITKDLLA